MPDDDNAREMEAALHEDDEPEVIDTRSPEEIRAIEEEARAEEEFIADQEDAVNPLIFDKDAQQEEQKPEAKPKDESLDGAFGSEGLAEEEPVIPVSNEEELRKESVNEDNLNSTPMSDDLGADSNPDTVVDEIASLDTELSNDSDVAMGAEADTAKKDATADVTPEPAPAPEPVAPEPEPAPAPAPAPEPAPASFAAAAPAAAPQPIPAGMPTSSTPAATTAPVAGEKPKKKKTGLIITILLLVLLIGGGVFGFFWYKQHEAPEKQVSDAIENILDAPILGTVAKNSTVASGNSPLVKFNIKADNDVMNGNPITADIAFKGETSVYFKVGGLKGITTNLKKTAMEEADSSTKESIDMVFDIVDSVVGEIDDKWIVAEIDTSSNEKLKCINDVSKKFMGESFRKKMSDAYKANPFIKVKDNAVAESRDGINYYEVEIDKDANEKFGKAIEDTDEAKEFTTCIESLLGGGTVYENGATKSTYGLDDDDDDDDYYYYDDDDDDDYSFSFDEEPITTIGGEDKTVKKIKLGITPWTHELRAIEIDVSDPDDAKAHTVANISFDTVADSQLSDAKDVKKLIEDIAKKVSEAVEKITEASYRSQCQEWIDDGYGAYFSDYFTTVEGCVDYMKDMSEQYGGGSGSGIMDILGNLTSASSIEDFEIVDRL